MVQAQQRLTMTIEECAKALGIGRTLAYEMARAKKLPTIQCGRKLLVPRVAFERMLAEAGQPVGQN